MLILIGGKPSTDNKPIGKPSSNSRVPLEFADTLPQQMVDAGIPAIEITGGGEPTLWPAFDKLVENLYKLRRQIGLVTNGSNLSESRINLISKACTWIRVSMDSSNEEMHQKIHRTPNNDFNRRLDNIKKIAEKKHKDLVLGISFIITPQNVSDIVDSAELYSRIKGINHLRYSWMFDMEGHAGLTQKTIQEVKKTLDGLIEKHNRSDFRIFYERNRIDTYTKPNTDFNKCYYQRFVWAIGADCKVYPCCIMKYHPDFAYADLKELSLAQIVNDFTTTQMMDSLVPKGCRPCWLRERNKSIANGVEKPMHHNFI